MSEAFLRELKTALRQFYGEDPQRIPDYARIVNRRHFDRVTGLLAGGTLSHSGRSDAADLYLEPTVVTGVPWDAPVLQEEIFGPILPVIPFQRLDAAIEQLRTRPAPLALYEVASGSSRPTSQLTPSCTSSQGWPTALLA